MWNSSAFTAGFDSKTGGGFLNSSSDFGTPMSSPQPEKKKNERLNNVVPCTIANILQTPEIQEHLKIGSMTAHMITIVGMVLSVDEQSTRMTYVVDDKTSQPIEVQMWLGENEGFSSEKRSAIMENTYIRVTGVLRVLKDKRLVIAFKVTPILDLNEMTMHFLEVIHTAMAVAVMDAQGSNPVTPHNAGTFSTNKMDMNSTYNFSGGINSSVSFGLNKAQQIVFQAISSTKAEEGVSYDYLFSTIKSLNRQTIKETVDFLSNEGHIYSTIDDEHFKSTDSG